LYSGNESMSGLQLTARLLLSANHMQFQYKAPA
jgi:hypothetical protein